MNTLTEQFNDLNLNHKNVYIEERFHGGSKYVRFVKSKTGKIFGLILITPSEKDRRHVYRDGDRTFVHEYPHQWIFIRNIHSDGRCSYYGTQMTDNLDEVAYRLHTLE